VSRPSFPRGSTNKITTDSEPPDFCKTFFLTISDKARIDLKSAFRRKIFTRPMAANWPGSRGHETPLELTLKENERIDLKPSLPPTQEKRALRHHPAPSAAQRTNS